MQQPNLDIGFVTDEVSRDLKESLGICDSWGIRLFELREGQSQRFPFFSPDEIDTVHRALERGSRITAVSPGTFKSPVEDVEAIEHDLTVKLPAALKLAKQFDCDRMIVFGFEAREKSNESREKVLDVMRRACDLASASDITLAVENEPAFWFDAAQECVNLLQEVDHPALKLNWDPANMHWGGHCPTKSDFETVRPYMVNLHVKDYTPDDAQMPWRPVGEGVTPWKEILTWICEARDEGWQLDHLTIETHYIPAEEGSRISLANVRNLLEVIQSRRTNNQ
ncbi:MAG: sugar phosphate isomerase/epimerase [Rhodothermales bacterium]|nr:sugar phosphate isomerase/epimerase [Rhodothermales bacterium]